WKSDVPVEQIVRVISAVQRVPNLILAGAVDRQGLYSGCGIRGQAGISIWRSYRLYARHQQRQIGEGSFRQREIDDSTGIDNFLDRGVARFHGRAGGLD